MSPVDTAPAACWFGCLSPNSCRHQFLPGSGELDRVGPSPGAKPLCDACEQDTALRPQAPPVAQGQRSEGIAQLREGLAAYRATGAVVLSTYWCAILAETRGEANQIREGLGVLDEALAMVRAHEERRWEAELYRLKGVFHLAQAEAKSSEAEACLQQALTIARRQYTKSLELRAAMSLARFWQTQGKQDDARRLLGDVYSWFTEGFDTADLQEAKALLDELR